METTNHIPEAAAPAFTAPALSAFDRASRTVLIGASLTVIGALFGTVLGAFGFQPFTLVMAALALTAAGAAYASQALDLRASVKGRLPAIEAVAGAVATSLGSLAVLEMLGDLDDLEDYGGPIGLAVAIVVLTGSMAMLVGALRGSAPDLRSSERGTKVATLGAALVLGAWVLHLTVGFWSLGPAVWGIVAIVLAAAILLFGSTDEETSAPLGVVAVGLGLFAAFTALGQWSELMRLGETRLELGPADILPFLVYVTGIVLVIAGGVLQARGGRFAIPTMAPSRDEA